jgi:hypothetical protein
MEYLGKACSISDIPCPKYWGGVWGGFLEKMFLNREKTTPKPTPPF